MARNTTDFAQHNTERAVQATNWALAIAEQNLNQSRAALEGLLTFTGMLFVALISNRPLSATTL
jgi:hypothetical protein